MLYLPEKLLLLKLIFGLYSGLHGAFGEDKLLFSLIPIRIKDESQSSKHERKLETNNEKMLKSSEQTREKETPKAFNSVS